MIELYTPLEIIERAVQIIETERKVQKLQQKELALKANVPLPTYKQFIYSYKISLFRRRIHRLQRLHRLRPAAQARRPRQHCGDHEPRIFHKKRRPFRLVFRRT